MDAGSQNGRRKPPAVTRYPGAELSFCVFRAKFFSVFRGTTTGKVNGSIVNFLQQIVNQALAVPNVSTRAVFCYNPAVPGGKRKKPERPVFDSIRKPTAPPSQRIGKDKPEERVHPSGRKEKHKRKPEPED